MRDAGVEPDAVSYTALIDASGKAGDIRRATELLQEMRSAGAMPDQVRTVCGGACGQLQSCARVMFVSHTPPGLAFPPAKRKLIYPASDTNL